VRFALKRLNPNKLHVTFEGITSIEPIVPRFYTLTHSDETGELFLDIGLDYKYSKIGALRDEVLAHWMVFKNNYIFSAYCYVGGEEGIDSAGIRYSIFKKELPLALEAFRYGDRKLFSSYPALKEAIIYICFDSIYPYYNRIENFGVFSDYE
jgi:hypothetical protein